MALTSLSKRVSSRAVTSTCVTTDLEGSQEQKQHGETLHHGRHLPFGNTTEFPSLWPYITPASLPRLPAHHMKPFGGRVRSIPGNTPVSGAGVSALSHETAFARPSRHDHHTHFMKMLPTPPLPALGKPT